MLRVVWDIEALLTFGTLYNLFESITLPNTRGGAGPQAYTAVKNKSVHPSDEGVDGGGDHGKGFTP
jgi:hypothetical protein